MFLQERRWREMESSSILISLVLIYPAISPGWSWPVPFVWYQTHLGARNLKAWLVVLSLKSKGHGNLHQRGWCCSWGQGQASVQVGRKLPPPQAPMCQTLLLSHDILPDITAAPPDPAGSLIGGRIEWTLLLFHTKGFSLGRHSFLAGREYSPSFLDFLSLMLPSCVTRLRLDKLHRSSRELQCRERPALLPTAGSASRKAGSCIKISAHFVHPVSLNKLHHRATGSALLIPAIGWSLSAAFDLSWYNPVLSPDTAFERFVAFHLQL